jgi:dsDNA-binding SOS-regulon protein
MNKSSNTTGLAAGRPSAGKKNFSMADDVVLVRINAQVTEAQHQKLKVYAAKNKTSVSELLRAYIASLPE